MLKLVRKDIQLQRNTMLIMLPFLFFYLYTGTSIIFMSILFCIALTMNAFATDEKSPINLLLNSLPYTRKEIVSSKYISACFFTALVLLTSMLGNWVFHREIIPWELVLFIVAFVGLFFSFAFPFSYLLSSQYLMLGGIVIFVIYLIITNKFIHDLNDRIRSLTQSILSADQTSLYALVLLSIVVFYVISWILSVRIYSRKVF